jgi:hypothetical protein
VEEIISNIPEGFTVVVEDESIFVHDMLVRRKWTSEGMRPIVVTTGSHQKTCVFGTLCIDGRQFFRQYNTFNQYTFLEYLKELQSKFHKVILFLDRAPQGTAVQSRSESIWKRIKMILELGDFPRVLLNSTQ